MNCPYCGKPMEEGKLPGDRQLGMYWLTEDKKIPVAFAYWEADDVNAISLADPKLFGVPSIKAHICRSCKKGVFDLP